MPTSWTREPPASIASSSTATSPASTTTRSASGSKSSIDGNPPRREQSWRGETRDAPRTQVLMLGFSRWAAVLPPHPPFGHLLPQGEKGTVERPRRATDQRGDEKRSPSPQRGEGRG